MVKKITLLCVKSQYIILLTFACLALYIILALYVPQYLNYADQPAKADAVVLIVGPDYNARMREAYRLITEGYAAYLIIPAYGQHSQLLAIEDATTDRGNGQEKPKAKKFAIVQLEANAQSMQRRSPNYHCYYENTHIDVLEAKRIVDQRGFRSILFVSSPFHMRRIRMIVGEVFDPAHYHTTFIPTRFEQSPGGLQKFAPTQVANVILECTKILWFQVYKLLPTKK